MSAAAGIAALLIAGCAALGGGREPSPPAGLLLLGEGRVLAWSADGRLRAGRVGEGLAEAPRLPLTYVVDALAWEERALLAGSVGTPGQEEQALVVEVDAQGVVRASWSLGAGVATAVAGGPEKPVAAAFSGLYALEAGEVRLMAPSPSLTIVRGTAHRPILCQPANLTVASQAPAVCTWTDDAGAEHRALGAWTSAPLLCGAWVLEPGPVGVEVRALTDGVVAGAFARGADAPVACLDEHTALVGGEGAHVIALPGGQETTALPCGSGPAVLIATAGGSAACLAGDGRVYRLEP
ncbi:MAG: hypothetical protein ABIO70_09905 [Pseudomonadota bacterium]